MDDNMVHPEKQGSGSKDTIEVEELELPQKTALFA